MSLPVWFSKRAGRPLLLAMSLLAIALVALALAFHRRQYLEARIRIERSLSAITRLKLDQCRGWQTGQLLDVQDLVNDGRFRDGAAAALGGRDPGRAWRDWLTDTLLRHQYQELLLVDGAGRACWRATGRAPGLAPEELAILAAARREGQPRATDLYRRPGSGRIYQSIAASLPKGGGLILVAGAEDTLYPLIQSWPVPTRSAETVLVERQDGAALVLNELRHRKGSALTLRLPMGDPRLLCTEALSGREGLVEGVDYRGVPVIGVLSKVPGTPWVMVNKLDRAEAFGETWVEGRLLAGVVAGLLLALGCVGLAFHLWLARARAALAQGRLALDLEAQRLRAATDLAASEAQHRRTLERLNQVLANVEDLVWSALPDSSRVLSVNGACERIYGMSVEAFQADPRAWWQRVHPDDRPVAERSARELRAKGFSEAEYRVIRADGSIRWVRDRKSQLLDEHGQVREVGGVATDITEAKASEQRVLIQRDLGLALGQTDALETGLAHCLEAVHSLCGWHAVGIYRLDASRELVRLTARGFTPALLAATSRFPAASFPARQVSEGKGDWDIDPAAVGPALQSLERAEGWRRKAMLPLPLGGRNLGCLIMATDQGEPLPPRPRLALELVAAQIGAFLARMEAQEALRQHALNLEGEVVAGTAERGHLSDRLNLVLNAASDGIFGLDPEGVCTFVNRAALEILGYGAAEEVLGRDGRVLFQVTRSGASAPEVMRRKDGSEVPVSQASRPFIEGDPALGTVVTFTDNTERLAREASLARAKEAAEAASRAKSAFLANMSHEIRTPLNAVLGFTQLLLREPGLTERQQAHLRTINQAGDHLLGLINDVLDLSRIEAGRATLAEEAFDLHGTVDDLVALFRPRAEGKGLVLECTLAADVPRWVRGDAPKLRQILINLLGNAVKFTAAGRVDWLISARSGDEGLEVRMEVRDTGPGIRKEDQERLFDAFEQGAQGSPEGGAGLGLAISRQFARMMGGTLEVRSEPGQGSAFILALGLRPGEPALAEAWAGSPAPLVRPEFAACRLLVVDDRADNRALLREFLLPAGFTVREAAGGADALALVGSWAPRAVLMDIRMPGMDGLEATRRIKAMPGGADVKVIVLSASALDTNQDEAMAAGADGFIAKPFRLAELFGALERTLRPAWGAQDGPAPAEKAAPGSGAAGSGAAGSGAAGSGAAGLGPDLVRRLRRGATLANYAELIALVTPLAAENPAAAAFLRRRIERFDYPGLLGFLEGLG